MVELERNGRMLWLFAVEGEGKMKKTMKMVAIGSNDYGAVRSGQVGVGVGRGRFSAR